MYMYMSFVVIHATGTCCFCFALTRHLLAGKLKFDPLTRKLKYNDTDAADWVCKVVTCGGGGGTGSGGRHLHRLLHEAAHASAEWDGGDNANNVETPAQKEFFGWVLTVGVTACSL